LLLPVVTDDDDVLLPVEQWVDTPIFITLDSGCVEHVMDITHAPGHAAFMVASQGSRRLQNFVVGNGQKVPNEGEVALNMECGGVPLRSVFQVAEVTRPLMSVGRVCDQGMKCLFDDKSALVLAPDGTEVCRFERQGGLYVAKLMLKNPVDFHRQAR
jgi:hypothetical protein